MNCLELFEGIEGIEGTEGITGAQRQRHMTLQLIPQAVSEEEAVRTVQRWIDYIFPFCHPSCECDEIFHYGFMQKRGVSNSQYQVRWFVLTSNLQLVYYRTKRNCTRELLEQVGTSFKGEIDLSQVSARLCLIHSRQ